jgi:hypothetical protein
MKYDWRGFQAVSRTPIDGSAICSSSILGQAIVHLGSGAHSGVTRHIAKTRQSREVRRGRHRPTPGGCPQASPGHRELNLLSSTKPSARAAVAPSVPDKDVRSASGAANAGSGASDVAHVTRALAFLKPGRAICKIALADF